MIRRHLACAVVALVVLLAGSPASSERPPVWVAVIAFDGGETRLDLADETPTPLTLPAPFAAARWGCYIDATQIVAGAFTKQVTCGGPWGLVDTFVSCGPKQRNGLGFLKVRKPLDSKKTEVSEAEKITITVGCAYGKK